MANKYKKVWKVISRKSLSNKQTHRRVQIRGSYYTAKSSIINALFIYLVGSGFLKIIFKFFCIYLSFKKLINVKEKFGLVFRKVFFFFSGRKYFIKVVKKLEISYYLLIITNLIVKLLIAIYFVLNFFFLQFHSLEFNFYINFGAYFYDCYLLFSYYFFNWNFLSIKFGLYSFGYYLFYLK